ncbi:IS66 family insertion sequence element accessory protein TnpB [soil metagenome]
MIRVDAVWLAVEPLDMRAGTESALTRVVNVFGAARPHHAYLFANRRANRMKVLVHDGIGVWLAARRLNSGKFIWPKDAAATASLTRAQFDALVLGLPWQRIGEAGIIRIL